jgi:hypothetical protein
MKKEFRIIQVEPGYMLQVRIVQFWIFPTEWHWVSNYATLEEAKASKQRQLGYTGSKDVKVVG